jgi:hypothetical protein
VFDGWGQVVHDWRVGPLEGDGAFGFRVTLEGLLLV